MSKRIFTKEQREKLSKNPNVKRCSEKSITYAKDFKLRAVKEYGEEGLSPNHIFKKAGFERPMIGEKMPGHCLNRWRKTYEIKGAEGLSVERRGSSGGRPKTKGVTDEDKIKWLEAKVAYLTAENDFLAKLRAKRKE